MDVPLAKYQYKKVFFIVKENFTKYISIVGTPVTKIFLVQSTDYL